MKTLTPRQRELLQVAILETLLASGSRFGLNGEAITFHVRESFPHITSDQVEPELDYLTEKGLVALVGKVLEPANRQWKLSAQGRDFLSERQE